MSVILNYLSELERNNNREWYHAHKAEYKEANEAFETLVQDLICRLGKTDADILRFEPKELTFKLNRDTRFSHDKSPYHTAFRCHISPGGKLPVPVGYFLFLSPGNRSFLGAGLFADMFKDATKMIRDYIYTHGQELEQILKEPAFRELFEIQGSALKNVPKDYEPDHPMAEYLKYKSWYIEFPVEDSLLEDTEKFAEYAQEKFLKMKPFNDYLNRALEGFKMPVR